MAINAIMNRFGIIIIIVDFKAVLISTAYSYVSSVCRISVYRSTWNLTATYNVSAMYRYLRLTINDSLV